MGSSTAAALLASFPRVGRGDDMVGNPHRVQISHFELFELFLLLKLHKHLPVERFEATVSQSPPPLNALHILSERATRAPGPCAPVVRQTRERTGAGTVWAEVAHRVRNGLGPFSASKQGAFAAGCFICPKPAR